MTDLVRSFTRPDADMLYDIDHMPAVHMSRRLKEATVKNGRESYTLFSESVSCTILGACRQGSRI